MMVDDSVVQSLLYREGEHYGVRLEGFEGPLELLLHLIRKHKYDIYDIPIASILDDYLEVIEVLDELDLDVAGEFLLMAATLTQIKARMLLPKHTDEDEEGGEDPRAELVRRLLEYERFRDAASGLQDRPILGRDVFVRTEPPPDLMDVEQPDPPIVTDLFQLIMAFREVLKEAPDEFVHEVTRQRMTTPEAMTEVLDLLAKVEEGGSVTFRSLFPGKPTKDRIIAIFMGLMELIRLRAVKFSQPVEFGDIYLMPPAAQEGEDE
jgi:segregation and condensation protein A